MPKYFGDITLDRLAMLEFAIGSCGLSRRQALIELGFPEEAVDKLMEERAKEEEARDKWPF